MFKTQRIRLGNIKKKLKQYENKSTTDELKILKIRKNFKQ